MEVLGFFDYDDDISLDEHDTETDTDNDSESGSSYESDKENDDMDHSYPDLELEDNTGISNQWTLQSIFPNIYKYAISAQKYSYLITSVVLTFLIISNGWAANHFDGLLKVLFALGVVLNSGNISVRQMKNQIKSCLWPSISVFDINYYCETCSTIKKKTKNVVV